MEVQQLKCLIAVNKYKSFTKAAEAVFMSQSSISKIISSLEDELGVSLVKRNRHKVTITQAGEYLVEHAEQIVRTLDKIEEKTRRIGSGIDSFIQIGMCDELDINRLLPHFLKNFSVGNPSIEIDFAIHPITKLREMIVTGELDVAFAPSVMEAMADGVVRIPIYRDSPKLYFSSNHPKAGKKNLTINDFLGDQVIVLTESEDDTLHRLENMGYRFRLKKSVKSINVMKLYIEAGLGVAILGTSQTFFGSTKVRHISIPIQDYYVGTDAIYLKNSPNPAVGLFIENLTCYLEERDSTLHDKR